MKFLSYESRLVGDEARARGGARDQALSGRYDLVCYGHDHEAHVERVGNTLLVNPGEVMGRLGPSRYAVYDTETGEAELRQI